MTNGRVHIGIVRYLSRRLLPLATGVGLLLALAAPLTYWYIEHRNLAHFTSMYATELAGRFADFALEAPELWKYQTYKFMKLVDHFHPAIDVLGFCVLDEKGEPVGGYEYGKSWKRHSGELTFWEELRVTLARVPIVFNNRRVGTVEVLVSDQRLLRANAVLFTFSVLIGAVLAFVMYRFPIRVTRRMEESLEELIDTVQKSERKYRSLINNIPDVTWTADRDGRPVFVSPNIEKVYGYTPKEVYSAGSFIRLRRIHPDDAERVEKAYKDFFTHGGDFDVEYRARKRDGEWIWLRDRAVGTYEKDGETYADGLFSDITERKRADEALRRAMEFSRTVMNSMNDPISIIDVSDSRVVGCNTAFLREVGLSEAQALGLRCFELTHRRTEPCCPPLDPCPLRETVATGRYAVAEHLHFGANGEEIHVEVSTAPIFDECGKVTRVVHASRDITERKRAEEALKGQAKELARSNAELEQFAYVASHDLQEPLRMVASYMQLLSRRYKGKLDADADEFIAFAVDGAGRMQRLINDLLLYSRVGSKGKEPQPTECEAVLRHALDNLQEAVRESGAQVDTSPMPAVMGDDVQLVQLFQNLIGNALKFRGEEPPRVEVQAEPQGEEWLFSVRDNGIGIESKDFERIFQIFQRLHDRESYPGTGIGLAVCKKIVERHGGRIWVESEPGEGTTFYFTLSGVKEA
jgi:PAS domain S-box-containing protein